jgi:hypothetical protein
MMPTIATVVMRRSEMRYVGAAVAIFVWSRMTLCGGQSFASYAEGKQFLVEVEDEALLKTPEWSVSAANPPLSARRAINAASEARKTLVSDREGSKWEVLQVELVPDTDVDRWFWVVTAERRAGDNKVGDLSTLRLAVLMDGTVVKPQITQRARRPALE